MGIGGNGADDGVDFGVDFFSNGTGFGVSTFLLEENGLEGALLDNGGKAAAPPVLRFSGPSFDFALPTEEGIDAASFFFMSTVALKFSGVVPNLARVSREAFESVVCFNSCGAFISNLFIWFLSIVDGLSQPLLAFVFEGGEKMLILVDKVSARSCPTFGLRCVDGLRSKLRDGVFCFATLFLALGVWSLFPPTERVLKRLTRTLVFPSCCSDDSMPFQ